MLSRFHRNNGRFAVILSLIFAGGVLPRPASGQERRPNNPFAKQFGGGDPQEFFKKFFGAETDEDRAAVEKMKVSTREERRIGQSAVDAYLAGMKRRAKVTDRGKDVEYLRKLVTTLRPMMKNAGRYRSIRVFLVESDEPDARSFPGGTLIFFRGMLDLAENEAALAGVVGHELSHLDHQHQLYDAKRMKLAQRTFTGGNGFSPEAFFRDGMMLAKSFSRPFRPEEESEADADGVRWVYKVGYDPREMAKLFLRMAERSREARGAPAFFRTHPYHADR